MNAIHIISQFYGSVNPEEQRNKHSVDLPEQRKKPLFLNATTATPPADLFGQIRMSPKQHTTGERSEIK